MLGVEPALNLWIIPPLKGVLPLRYALDVLMSTPQVSALVFTIPLSMFCVCFCKERNTLGSSSLGPDTCVCSYVLRQGLLCSLDSLEFTCRPGFKLTEICLFLHSWVLGLKVSATMPSLGLNIWKCVYSGSPLWLTLENEWQTDQSSAYFTEQYTKTVHFVILIKSVDSPCGNKVDSPR